MKHDLDYMIAVMKAAKEGKEIERSSVASEVTLGDKNWNPVDNPLWDWTSYDYRIKPEEPKPEYVPYENARDFLQAQEQHGPYIRSFNRLVFPVCVEFYENEKPISRITYADGHSDFISNLVNFTWQDGTPCGKIKQ